MILAIINSLNGVSSRYLSFLDNNEQILEGYISFLASFKPLFHSAAAAAAAAAVVVEALLREPNWPLGGFFFLKLKQKA